MLVCLGFIHILEIIARILSEVVNRKRLCGTTHERPGAESLYHTLYAFENMGGHLCEKTMEKLIPFEKFW